MPAGSDGLPKLSGMRNLFSGDLLLVTEARGCDGYRCGTDNGFGV